MKLILIIGSVALPIIMVYSEKFWLRLRDIYNAISMIALLTFGNIASFSIYKVIIDGTVFMTAIHGVFLNPFFLIAGAYIGIYVLYRLLLLSIKEQGKD